MTKLSKSTADVVNQMTAIHTLATSQGIELDPKSLGKLWEDKQVRELAGTLVELAAEAKKIASAKKISNLSKAITDGSAEKDPDVARSLDEEKQIVTQIIGRIRIILSSKKN